jgi:alkanesulfonate monooxygenase SsuD/methylene tetrahydromethanopterin reductase-like flavin-dependent oxidoreductase (luciferase family)
MPAGMPVEQIRKYVGILKETCASLGGDASQMAVAPQFTCYIGETHEAAVDRFSRSQLYEHLVSLKDSTLKDQAGLDLVEINLVGTVGEVIEKAKKFEAAGVTHLCGTYFCADTVAELKDQMQIFAEEVMPYLTK